MVSPIFLILSILVCALDSTVYFLILKPRFKAFSFPLYFIISVAFFILTTFFLYSDNMAIVRIAVTNACLFAIVCWLYTDKFYIKLMVFIIQLLCGVLAEVLLVIVYSILEPAAFVQLSFYDNIIPSLSSLLVTVLLSAVFVRLWRKKRISTKYDFAINTVIFGAISFVEISFFTLAFISNAFYNNISAFIFMAIFLVLGYLFVYFAYRSTAEKDRITAQKTLLDNQVELAQQHYDDITAQVFATKRLRHDYLNNLSIIKGLLSSGNTVTALEYVSENLSESGSPKPLTAT